MSGSIPAAMPGGDPEPPAAAESPVIAETSGPALRDRVLGVRDQLVSDARFRRWVSRFPASRPVARRQAQALFDLCAGFVYSQILLACVQLRVFDLLQAGPLTAESLAPRLGLQHDDALRLLESAAALDLVDRRGSGRFGLGSLGAALVGNAGLTAMIEHHTMLYADLQDPVALLRTHGAEGTALRKFWAYSRSDQPAELGAEQVDQYSALMAASQEMVAEEVLDAYPHLVRHRCLLDIGGGDGAFLAAAASCAPSLRLILFDLPSVAERAKQRFEQSGLSARASAVGGDFRTGKLPRGADIASLVRVVHDHDDGDALTLLRAARDALPPGGTLLVAEPMAGTRGAGRMGAYFAFYLLAMGSGRPRTVEELFKLLHTAGFEGMRLLRTRTPLLTQVITAQVPGGARR